MNLFYKCDTLEYISYINTSIPLISKTLTSLNCWISLLSSSFMALQEKTGDEQKRKQRVLGVHTAKTAGVSTAAHFARKARTTIFVRTFAPQSLFLSANAGRGTTERGTRRERTWDKTRSNVGRRSPSKIGNGLSTTVFSSPHKDFHTHKKQKRQKDRA